MKYNIHLNVYDGPLDLLCDLISKQKIDIKDISILEITSQYLAYIDMLNEVETEEVSALSQVNSHVNNLRDDSVRESLTVEEALKNAPDGEDGAIIVPKVVGE